MDDGVLAGEQRGREQDSDDRTQVRADGGPEDSAPHLLFGDGHEEGVAHEEEGQHHRGRLGQGGEKCLAVELDMSKQGVHNRLATLEELDVLDSAPGANGRIYWLRDDRSNWPVPPDVAVVVVYQVARFFEAVVFALSLLVLGLGVGSLGPGIAAFVDWVRYRW